MTERPKQSSEILESADSKFLKEYHVDPLEKRVALLESRLTDEKLRSLSEKTFKEERGNENFRNKFVSLFNENLKIEIFINKVKSIAREEIKIHIDKSRIKTIFWIIGIVIATIIGLTLQKFFHVFKINRELPKKGFQTWIPACAGMTTSVVNPPSQWKMPQQHWT